MKHLIHAGLFIISVILGTIVKAQSPITKSSSAILHDLKKLKVLGSVLYIAAHPDDENTRLLAYLANDKQYRTAYLSLTRGDGGQNLIGNEQGIELGLIRTNELMAARRIDGAEQFFTRAYDFGFSKTPKETFDKWNHDSVLADVVWVVRKFQPDVIIARFPEDSRAGHGHHSASGILAREAFEAAGDPTKFPNQLKQGVKVWQPKRMLWNNYNFGGAGNIDSTQFVLDAGGYNPLTGLSNGELAGESRSQHKSQGFGVPRSRGSQREFFSTIHGDKPVYDLLDGVDITWKRVNQTLYTYSPATGTNGNSSAGTGVESLVPGSLKYQQAIDSLINIFQPEQPSNIVPGLLQLYSSIKNYTEPGVWQATKLNDLSELILNCTGLYIEATVPRQFLAENDSVRLSINMVSRSNIPVKAGQYHLTEGQIKDVVTELNFNQPLTHTAMVKVPKNFMQSQPYWLAEGLNGAMFFEKDQQKIGRPVNDPWSVRIELYFNRGNLLNITRPIQYKYTDPVKGEVYQPVFITPRHLVYSDNDIVLFKKGKADSSKIKIEVSSWEILNNEPAKVSIFSDGFNALKSIPAFSSVENGLQSYTFTLPNYLLNSSKQKDALVMQLTVGKTEYLNTQRTLQYDHLPTMRHYYMDNITVLNIDLKLAGKRVGYLVGAGDRVDAALVAMGYEVEILKEADLTDVNLARFDAIITGIRAYNVHEYLTQKYESLMNFVRNGGNLIVQYNTSSNVGPVKAKMSPYELGISRTRVTDEKSPVRFVIPKHPVWNTPNKITEADFEGWIQERSIYHGSNYDKAFAAPLGLKDFDENEETGSLLIAPYGKGNFVYTGLVFFRQLPAAVPGAFRILANLIGLPKNE